MFAVFEPPEECALSTSRAGAIAALRGEKNRSVQLHYLTSGQMTEANQSMTSLGVCCGSILQFHKLTIALRMVQRHEQQRATAYNAVVRFRTDHTAIPPLRADWLAVLAPGVMYGHMDYFFMARRDEFVSLEDVWPRTIHLLARGGPRAFRQLDWWRLARDSGSNRTHASYPYSCSNLYLSIDWPMAYVERLGRSPRADDLWRDAAELAAFNESVPTMQYCPWLRDGWRGHALRHHIVQPEVMLAFVVYSTERSRVRSLQCAATMLRDRHARKPFELEKTRMHTPKCAREGNASL